MKDMKVFSGLQHLEGKSSLLKRLQSGQNEKQLAKMQLIDHERTMSAVLGPNVETLADLKTRLTGVLKLRTENLGRHVAAALYGDQPDDPRNLDVETVVQKLVGASDAATAGGRTLTPNELLAGMRADVHSQMETSRADPETKTALERIIGVSDLLPLWYLARGLQAAQAVGVVCVDGRKIGTGFLVGRQLLLTNNHVLGLEPGGDESVEFDFAADEFDRELPTTTFRLNRNLCCITSPEDQLDFTLIGVEAVSDEGMELERYGFLRLNPRTGKIRENEAVAIIGHPNGETKQVALRDNRVLKIGSAGLEHCLWYTTDTLPGSSGSPVFNDQWQVVALHHKAIPEPCNNNGRKGFKSVDGNCVEDEHLKNFSDERVVWLANEGIRISEIVRHCRARPEATDNELVKAWVGDMGAAPYTGTRAESPVVTFGNLRERQRDTESGRFDQRTGYDPTFLSRQGKKFDIPLFDLRDKELGTFTPLLDGSGFDLKYMHSSIRMNQERRLAYYTAVNIHGPTWVAIKRDRDVWQYDDRISPQDQAGPIVYSREPGPKGWFDRGHLIRRLDPVWGEGEVPVTANDDTFVWTNCSPQHWSFNQSDQFWQGLENFILNNVSTDRLRASVFSGPVFSNDDEPHRGIQIPKAYWKIVAVLDEEGKLHTSAYRVPQDQFATGIPFEVIPVGQFKGFQISVAELEELTHLDFGDVLKTHDAWHGQGETQLKGFESMKWRQS